jgi:cell division protein FtsI/penicillin-binding protein 2
MNSAANQRPGSFSSANRRLYVWYGVLIFIGVVIVLRLFYLQVIRHDYYRKAALSDQLRQYSIPAARGVIEVHDSEGTVPIVLNQTLYTLYADPAVVKDVDKTSAKVAVAANLSKSDVEKSLLTKNTRYVILAKRLGQGQKDKITALRMPGIGTQAQDYRIYPDGSLAAQLLGFVNGDGKGTYGVEQALNTQLAGTPGMLKAITDAAGVPLAASRDNVQINPKPGENIVLTLDIGIQKQLETYLKNNVERSKGASGSAIIMDPNTGAIKAMANYPTYDPSQYFNVKDAQVFNNASVSAPLEVGSIMKTLTAAAALDQKVVTPETTYYDPAQWPLDGSVIKNVEEDGGAGTTDLARILGLSMNTGATWLLMQMGHQTGSVNKTARDHWHDYMVNHYMLGKATGIEQGYEAAGYIPNPDQGDALQLVYANTSFGQAMTATPLQMAAALSSVLNGGTYYKPHLVDQTEAGGKTDKNKPEAVKKNVVSGSVSKQMQDLMAGVVKFKVTQGFPYMNFPDNYSVGGKTGTAEIANPAGGYYGDRFNGTFIGFVGGDKPQYVIVVLVREPHIGGYAGSTAAMPLFADLAHMLINNFNVTPKS